jgi:putative thioredoxin
MRHNRGVNQSNMNLQGAIDLGAVAAAREAQAKAAQAAAQRAADPVASNLIIDVTTSSFETDVITQSMTVPVVVDLWATWCEPCKQLSPILEKLALEYDGRWILAKVDVDAEQQIAAAFQVQSIPTVYVVIGGQVAPMFQGAMPESQVRQVLEAVLAEAEKAGITGRVGPNADAAAEAGKASEVMQPPSDPRFDAAEAALESGDWAKAAEAYKEILSVTPGDAIAKIGLLNVNLLQRTDGRDLAADVETMTLETDSVLRAADSTFLMGEFADAFSLLIEHLKNVTGTERDQTRERVLELFEIAGPADPAVVKARIALTNALF